MRRARNDAEKEIRRQQILAAAKDIFATEGFHDATIAAVARRAGLSYGSVYSYFDSKQAVFHALMETEARALRNAIAQAIVGTSGDSSDALREAIRAVFAFFDSDPSSAALLFRDPPTQGQSFARHLAKINEQFVDDLAVAITVSQERGRLRDDIPARSAAQMLALVVGQLALHRVTDPTESAATTADHVVRFALEGLLPR